MPNVDRNTDLHSCGPDCDEPACAIARLERKLAERDARIKELEGAPDVLVQNAALTGEVMILTAELAAAQESGSRLANDLAAQCTRNSELIDAIAAARAVPVFDFIAHLHRQREWSEKTFGPGTRLYGVTDHIAKELIEVRESGGDLKEWIDCVILSLDGAWRSGATPEQIIEAMVSKQAKNEGRTWPDWRTMPPDTAIEHDRSFDEAAPKEPK